MENSLEKINREIGAKIRGEYGIRKGNEISFYGRSKGRM